MNAIIAVAVTATQLATGQANKKKTLTRPLAVSGGLR